jgi:hypothetical protein
MIQKGGSDDPLCAHRSRTWLVPEGWRPDGELAAATSNTVVQSLARTNPTLAQTKAKTALGDNGLFVVLQDSLTRGERTLADAPTKERRSAARVGPAACGGPQVLRLTRLYPTRRDFSSRRGCLTNWIPSGR